MTELLKNCRLCPRQCGVDRLSGQAGRCHATGDTVRVARVAPHYWEEPCVSGERGSGAVFFGGCNLGCVYCQNSRISRSAAGREMTVSELSDSFRRLEADGVHNINLVTPTHYLPQICMAIDSAGVHLPYVYNTSGYELAQSLELLRGRVGVFLTDFKYADSRLADSLSSAPDYPRVATDALDKMVDIAGDARFDDDGIMQRGVIVRHLVLPGHSDDSMRVIEHLYDRYGDSIYISIMNQYTPMDGMAGELSRKVGEREYERVIDFAVGIGVENGFIQEGETADDSFIPSFDLE